MHQLCPNLILKDMKMPYVPKILLLIEASRGHGRLLLRGIANYIRLHGPWSVHPEIFERFYRDDSGYVLGFNNLFSNGSNIDGVITRDIERAQQFIDEGIPTIMAIQPPKINKNIPHIVIEHDKIGQMAAEHMFNRGFRNFAFYGFSNMYWSDKRAEGFRSYLSEAGFDADIYRMANNNYYEGGIEHSGVASWLRSLPKPCALLAVNDDRAQYITSLCNWLDIKVPEDIAIVGVDNDDLICDLSDPSLSSIALNTQRAGYEAAGLLDRLIGGEKMDGQIITIEPTHVIERQSTDIVTIEDEDISVAIRFIRENAKRAIQVNEVADAVGLGRRTLERRFLKHLRCTVNREIQRVRVEYMARLICETMMPIADIAQQTGFPSIDHISRYFKREKGLTPVEYRQKYSLLL
ncbi:MAG: substrate-binding domain-containing protein [Sedimentisphaeraceae bacterium JB056]